MRDLETVSIAIETAETGHLVFGTLHTTTAASTDRPDHRPVPGRPAVAGAGDALGVAARRHRPDALSSKIGGGRVAAREILLSIPAVSNLIREGKTFQIPSIMQTNRKTGMVTLNDALMELVDSHLVEPKEAYMKAVEKAGFAAALKARRHDIASWARGDGGRGGQPEGRAAGQRGSAGLVPPLTVSPSSPILVLVNPQDIVNIASAVRIARNFGIERMRLVNPEIFDPYRIEGIAHNTRRLRGGNRDPGHAGGGGGRLRLMSRS